MRRLPSLDGLRALSIALVLFAHSIPGKTLGEYFGNVGQLGVRWFFVISGFLITTLLLAEQGKTGAISLPRFYLRRTLRIFPAFYVFLLVVFLGDSLGLLPDIDGTSWAHAVTYTSNYQPANDRPHNLAHLWSLAVEEQFYLLWPAALMLLGRARGIRLAAAVVLLVPLLRMAIRAIWPQHGITIPWHFQTICDSLATGCLLAGVRDALWERPAYRRLLGSWLPWLLFAGTFVINWYMAGRPRVAYLFAFTALNVSIAIFIDRCLRFPESPVGKLLNLRPVAYVGTLSYSIYLWQQLFFHRYPDHWLTTFPINLGCTLVAAWLSYRLIEQPFLRLKDRLAGERPAPAPLPMQASRET